MGCQGADSLVSSPSGARVPDQTDQRSSAYDSPSPVNNWLFLSILWLYELLVSQLLRCCGMRRWRLTPFCPDLVSRFTPESKVQSPHCYVNESVSQLSLVCVEPVLPATTTHSRLTDICDLDLFCRKIDSLRLPQRSLLDQVQRDRVIPTHPAEDRRRRTIIIERCNDSFGFTLQVILLAATASLLPSSPFARLPQQTYGIHHKKEAEVELLTYVDHVDLLGPAFKGWSQGEPRDDWDKFSRQLRVGGVRVRTQLLIREEVLPFPLLSLLDYCLEPCKLTPCPLANPSWTSRRRRHFIDQRTERGEGGPPVTGQVHLKLRENDANGCLIRRLCSQGAVTRSLPQAAGERVSCKWPLDTLVTVSLSITKRELSLKRQEYERLCQRETQIMSKVKTAVTDSTSGKASFTQVVGPLHQRLSRRPCHAFQPN